MRYAGRVAAKKGNGHDRVTSEMVEILRELRDDQKGMRIELTGNTEALRQVVGAVRTLHEEQRKTNERLDTLTGRVDTLTEHVHTLAEDVHAMRADLSSLERNVGSIRTETRAEVRQYDERIRRLEDAVFKPAAE